MNDLVSICITCFNAQKTITKAILSAINQTYKNTEIIIYDDASQDKSVSTLKELNRRYPELKVIYNAENMGVAHARNKLIEAANGEFVVFFDDDDESLPFRVEKQITSLMTQIEVNNCKNIISLCSRNQVLNNSNHIELSPAIDSILYPQQLITKALKGWYINEFVGSCATCSLAAPSKVLRELKFDESFRRKEDTDFFIRFAKSGGLIFGDSSILVNQKLTSGSDKNYEIENKYFLMLIKKHKELLTSKEYNFLLSFSVVKHQILKRKYLSSFFSLIKIMFSHPILFLRKTFAVYKSRELTKQRLSYMSHISSD